MKREKLVNLHGAIITVFPGTEPKTLVVSTAPPEMVSCLEIPDENPVLSYYLGIGFITTTPSGLDNYPDSSFGMVPLMQGKMNFHPRRFVIVDYFGLQFGVGDNTNYQPRKRRRIRKIWFRLPAR